MASEKSGRVPHHDPPPDARLTQPEADERGDSVVVTAALR